MSYRVSEVSGGSGEIDVGVLPPDPSYSKPSAIHSHIKTFNFSLRFFPSFSIIIVSHHLYPLHGSCSANSNMICQGLLLNFVKYVIYCTLYYGSLLRVLRLSRQLQNSPFPGCLDKQMPSS